MRKYKYTRTNFLGNKKRYITHTTKFYPKQKKWKLRRAYLGAVLTDKFKLYRHKYNKAKYINGVYTEVDYIPPIVKLKGFRRG